ncbi:MAG: sulfatase-like hydrolase/transferase [Anaerolineae bacterium]|nr:sulfatase-like hydrolase/transferase [Anaerolineae bacterium]
MTSPNIVWIYCDELRTDALGCYGHPTIQPQTPHLDALAANGTLFEQCFCNAPVCVPSRVATLTGRYPEETGVYHNEGAWPGYQMPVDVVTFPQVFADNGYVTANFGKWHVPPEMNRWDVCDAEGAGMRDLFTIVGRDDPSLIVPEGVPTYLGGAFPADVPYPHTVLVDNALDWIAQAEQPFLARLSFLEPHTPVYPPPPFDTLYDPAAFRDHLTHPEATSAFEAAFAGVLNSGNLSPRQIQLAQAYYYGLVAWIDSQVGRVLDYLERAGLMDHTIIVFGADHGASLGEGGCWAKHTYAPHVHRVPQLIQWRDTLPTGVRRQDLTESLDLARTLFGLCEIEPPESFRGRDLFHEDPPEAIYATLGFGEGASRAFPNLKVGDYAVRTSQPGTTGWPRRACVRTADYRLDKNVRVNGHKPLPKEEDIALYDVRDDPLEVANVAGDPAYGTVRAHLTALLDAHVADAVESDLSQVYSAQGR